jgi:peptidyl-tRNA hydrolase
MMIQYVVVRSDLLSALKWPTGAVIAQACHACSAVMHIFHSDPNTQAYVTNLDAMHKCVLQVRKSPFSMGCHFGKK